MAPDDGTRVADPARTPDELVEACRYPGGPEFLETSGLWTMTRTELPDLSGFPGAEGSGLEPGETLTCLFRITGETLHMAPYGECVMEDSRRELRKHLPILMAATGRVLVTGLGLGCVVRGLLAKPEVEHVDVVEVDDNVLRLVGWEFEEEPRVTVHKGDALTIPWTDDHLWDWAWHDAWLEDGPLDELHMKLILRYRDRVTNGQGAWGWNRTVKRTLERVYPALLV